ncbi:hypothetical protein SELMODRAFT_420997 [Selaginella moellendorffii]|uniref:Pentacotripeptide-repeat region of PRORP domain-containing protein n=1 Tax=Selaginella moellendorffii TaxID=88036 RepID=D8SDT5_SELML|nr:hypothetical protein SELMODRAFT_420997 [Selaginella moellendorffii]
MKAFRKGCSPNAVTYYILIAMFARLGDAPGLANLLGDSKCSSFRPDAMTYNTLLCGYSKMGMPEDFDKTHREMVEEEEELSKESYNALLVGYPWLDRLDELQRCVGAMLAREMSLASPLVAEEIAKAYRRNGWVEGLDTLFPEYGLTGCVHWKNFFKTMLLAFMVCGKQKLQQKKNPNKNPTGLQIVEN